MIERIYEMGREFSIKQIIRDTIRQNNQNLSLLTDDLIATAENSTKTREEYIAFMKGAAFIFYKIAQRENQQHYGTPNSISTPEEAIEHCIKLMPFMANDEKIEHLYVIQWLNDLLQFKGKETIKLPDEYFTDKEINAAISEFKNRRHADAHDNFESKTLITFKKL